MSDTSQGDGWWLASDGKWYPPDLWTGGPGTAPPGVAVPTFPGTPGPGQPQPGGVPAGGYGDAPPYSSAGSAASQPGAYPTYAAYGVGDGRTQKTNSLAVVSLICSCAGFFLLPVIPGIILGFVARSQIRRSNGSQRGDGLAIAGIIVGFGWVALLVLVGVLGSSSNTGSGAIGGAVGAALTGLVH